MTTIYTRRIDSRQLPALCSALIPGFIRLRDLVGHLELPAKPISHARDIRPTPQSLATLMHLLCVTYGDRIALTSESSITLRQKCVRTRYFESRYSKIFWEGYIPP